MNIRDNLERLAVGALLAIPAVLPFARRGGPPLLALAGLLALGGRAAHGFHKAPLDARETLFLKGAVLFLCVALTSCLWTPWPVRAAQAVGGVALVLGASACVLMFARRLMDDESRRIWFLVAVGAGAGVLVVNFLLHGSLLRGLYGRPEAYRFNMTVVSFSLLVWPALKLTGPGARLSWVVALLAACAIGLSESESAKLALAVGLVAFAAAKIAPWRVLALLTGALTTLLWFGLPVLISWTAWLADSVPAFAQAAHAHERLQIWAAFSQMALAGMPWGWGVESVFDPSQLSFFQTASATVQAGLSHMHPHNQPLQIAVELGLPGVALGYALHLAWLRFALTRKDVAPAFALFCAATTVCAVSHGFWQSWWWAALGLAHWALPSAASTKNGSVTQSEF